MFLRRVMLRRKITKQCGLWLTRKKKIQLPALSQAKQPDSREVTMDFPRVTREIIKKKLLNLNMTSKNNFIQEVKEEKLI